MHSLRFFLDGRLLLLWCGLLILTFRWRRTSSNLSSSGNSTLTLPQIGLLHTRLLGIEREVTCQSSNIHRLHSAVNSNCEAQFAKTLTCALIPVLSSDFPCKSFVHVGDSRRSNVPVCAIFPTRIVPNGVVGMRFFQAALCFLVERVRHNNFSVFG